MDRAACRRVIATAIRDWRASGGLERVRVSDHVGVAVRTVKRWEGAVTEPNVTDLLLMESLHPGIITRIESVAASFK